MCVRTRKRVYGTLEQETAQKGSVLCTSMVLRYRYLSAPTRRNRLALQMWGFHSSLRVLTKKTRISNEEPDGNR